MTRSIRILDSTRVDRELGLRRYVDAFLASVNVRNERLVAVDWDAESGSIVTGLDGRRRQ